MKIDVVAWGNDIKGLSFAKAKESDTFTALAFRYSEPVSYRGPRILAIHQTSKGQVVEEIPMTEEDREHESIPLPPVEIEKADEGTKAPVPEALAKRREKEPTLVALVGLPAASRHATVLLVPAAEGTFVGYVINDDPAKLPAGKLRVHNLSPHRIAMKVAGGEQKELDPRDTFVADAPDGHVIYQLSYQRDGKWKVQENNIVPVAPNEQTQFIVLKSRNQFFLSSDGATGGFLQMVTLRREVGS
jgi:hypothetical protein